MAAGFAGAGNEDVYKRQDQDMGHSGLSWQKDSSWGGYSVTTLHEYSGAANLKNALIYSDNIYFAKAALQIGADTLAQSLQKAGFGQEIPFAVEMNPSQYTLSLIHICKGSAEKYAQRNHWIAGNCDDSLYDRNAHADGSR